jgi:MFS family permease
MAAIQPRKSIIDRLCVKELIYAAVIMLGALNFGYNVGFGTPASESFAEEFNTTQFNETVFRSAIYLTAIPGAITAPPLLQHVGRRMLTFIYSAFGAVFWLLFFVVRFQDPYSFALAARCLSGVVVGGFSVLIPMYLVEISPPESTGFFGTLNQMAISFGIVVCYVIGQYQPWTWMAGVGAGICLLCSALIFFIPESPALTNVNPTMIVGEADGTLFARKWVWPMAVVLLMSFFQQSTGINPFLSHIKDFFDDSVMDVEDARILTAIAQVIGNFIGAFFTEYLGRRAIWVISLAGIAATDLAYAIIRTVDPDSIMVPNWAVLIDLFLFLFAFGFGAGPVPWFLVPETFPVRIRPLAGCIMAVSNWIFAFASMVGYDPLKEALSECGCFYIFAGCSVAGTLFGLFYIKNPEIQAREELHTNIFDDLVTR